MAAVVLSATLLRPSHPSSRPAVFVKSKLHYYDHSMRSFETMSTTADEDDEKKGKERVNLVKM